MPKKSKFDQYYTDLEETLAQKLRDARVKPEQLKTMEDGQILALEGISDQDLEKIRLAYEAVIEKEGEKPQKQEKKPPQTKTVKAKKIRSLRYKNLKAQVKKGKLYPIPNALKLLKKISQPHHTLELHLNVTQTGIRGEAKLPHTTGKELRVKIFSPSLETQIKNGKLNFDILLATPADMPKLARHAKLLGPKGLMPNPKTKTIVEDPSKRKQELEQGATLAYKTESKFPIIHLNLGPVSQDTKKTTENIKAIIQAIETKKIKSAFLTSTQSPSIKLNLV